jgi:hypothetical protein
VKKQSDEMLTIVRGGGTLLGGSGLLRSAGSLPHVLIDATSVFGILNNSQGSPLVDVAAILDGVKAVIEVPGDSHVVDLCVRLVRSDEGCSVIDTHLSPLRSDEGSDKTR